MGEWSPDGAYVLEGDVLEAGAGSPSVAAWRIRTGRINGVDVSGQVLLVASTRPRGDPEGGVARAILLDERASPEQALALLDAFRGRLGGPLAELAGAVSEERGFSQVPIEYRLARGRGAVSVTDRLSLVARPGHACALSVEVPEHDLAWHGHDVPATYQEFRFSSAAGPLLHHRPEQLLHRFQLPLVRVGWPGQGTRCRLHYV